MEFGFQLGNQEPLRIRDLAQAADDLGFDVIGFADHLIYEGPERQLDPTTLSTTPSESPRWSPRRPSGFASGISYCAISFAIRR